MRGWLAEIKRHHDIFEQIGAEKKMKVGVGTRDLKIAAITLAQDALLLFANLRDFQKVPGLRVENWLS